MIIMLKVNGGINKIFSNIEEAVDYLCKDSNRSRETTQKNIEKALRNKKYVYNNYRWRIKENINAE